MNLFRPTWDAEVAAGDSTLRAVRLAGHAGAQRLVANLYELEPGAMVSPLHFHHANEELICATNNMPEVAEQVETDTLAVITPSGLQLVTASAPVPAP